jgi:hypothetical protein
MFFFDFFFKSIHTHLWQQTRRIGVGNILKRLWVVVGLWCGVGGRAYMCVCECVCVCVCVYAYIYIYIHIYIYILVGGCWVKTVSAR